MPKSSESEIDRLRQQNIQLHKMLTALEAQLRESNRRSTELGKQLSESLAGNKDLRYQLKDLQAKLDILIVQFKKRNRKDYGSATEKHNPQKAPSVTRKKPRTPRTSPQADNISRKHIRRHKLPGEPVFHPVAPEKAICPHCSVATAFVSNKLSYQLDKIVSSMRYLEHQQEVRSCQKCKVYVVTAQKPDAAQGQFSPALRADIVTNRYGDGLPHNRQEKRFKREGVTIPRSTQSDCSLDSASDC